MRLKKIKYEKLNAKQKEAYNYQKVSSVLADYGYMTIKLDDDWQRADFIAKHINGDDYIKVQLKSRLAFYKKYMKRNLYICFCYKGQWYMYPHDEIVLKAKKVHKFHKTDSWTEKGGYSMKSVSKEMLKVLEPYKI